VYPFWFYSIIRNDFQVLTTCHTQYIWDRNICVYYLIVKHSKFILHIYRCSIYAHFVILQTSTREPISLQTIRILSAVMVSMAVLIRTFLSGIHTHTVAWNCAYRLGMELSEVGCLSDLVRNFGWATVHRQSVSINITIYT